MDFEIVRRVCQDYTLTGAKAMTEARGSITSPPFRFIYMSGVSAERDQTKTPGYMAQYSLMRGETENRLLAYAAEQNGAMEACVVKPGIITARGQYLKTIFATGLRLIGVVPSVDVGEASAAMLHQVVHGWEKEPYENEDLIRVGRLELEDAA